MSTFTRRDEEIRLCKEWTKDPLVNPRTGMPIARNGPTYKAMMKKCKELGLPSKPAKNTEKKLSARMCQLWRKSPHINPETGREIQVGGSMYKRIDRMCKGVDEKQIKLEGKYYVPDKLGMVPTVRGRGSFYVIRKAADRVVYGPLNSLTHKSKTALVYFKDTWDYHQGFYRPIFQNGEPQRPTNYKKPVTKTQRTNTVQPKANPKQSVDRFLGYFTGFK